MSSCNTFNPQNGLFCHTYSNLIYDTDVNTVVTLPPWRWIKDDAWKLFFFCTHVVCLMEPQSDVSPLSFPGMSESIPSLLQKSSRTWFVKLCISFHYCSFVWSLSLRTCTWIRSDSAERREIEIIKPYKSLKDRHLHVFTVENILTCLMNSCSTLYGLQMSESSHSRFTKEA